MAPEMTEVCSSSVLTREWGVLSRAGLIVERDVGDNLGSATGRRVNLHVSI